MKNYPPTTLHPPNLPLKITINHLLLTTTIKTMKTINPKKPSKPPSSLYPNLEKNLPNNKITHNNNNNNNKIILIIILTITIIMLIF